MITRRWPAVVEAELAERFSTQLNATDIPLDADALRAGLASFEIVCPTVTDRLSANLVTPITPRVRLLANYGAGVDHIDLDWCRAHGIVVTNTPGVLDEATAELALALMLMVARRLGEGMREVASGAWTGWRPTHLVGTSLAGKTLGLVGYGRIARAVARRAAAFGMTILGHSRSGAITGSDGVIVTPAGSLGELLRVADVVSLHVPGGAETRMLIGGDELAAMKPGAILINTARGSVIDHAALAASLKSGHLGGAGLDVYPDEPAIPPELAGIANLVLLPHLGSATDETRIAMGRRVLSNIKAFIRGEEPPDRIC